MVEKFIKTLLQCKIVAVVGLSKDPAKDSHSVARYLKEAGYFIIPINPTFPELWGKVGYPSLFSLPQGIAKEIELILIFRPSVEAEAIALEILEKKAFFPTLKGIWLQQGILAPRAQKEAEKAGLAFVQDHCMRTEHQKIN